MSSLSARALYAIVVVSISGSVACWEQWSEAWFPQMKWQKAVQAFEDMNFRSQREGFSPPEGTVPVSGPPPSFDNPDALQNPRSADLPSLENGRTQYDIFCATCHGATGLADGQVARVFPGVLPLVGIVRARSDGHIFQSITEGRRRMPNYARIPAEDRWDIINYVRYLDERGGRP